MEITAYGIIFALKNTGVWLASYAIADIKADLTSFMFAFIIYMLCTVPSDLFLLNHISTKAKNEAAQVE